MEQQAAIRMQGIGKRYVLGQASRGARYVALRDVFADRLRASHAWICGRATQPQVPSAPQEFWALQDVSFEARGGEVVGIIGQNGAGKSTLLKVLSRITEPTHGRVLVRGRVASLLEVGTGFHPELSGRENIFLNGAILGMPRAQIKGCFDQIVDFAGVERFLDTPVKRYSSGMYVRLAFAVAAHLEPEVLILDEVLAVGDAEFQKRCLRKMHEVARESGRTVVFVSHNMGAVQSLCSRVLVLANGRVGFDGDTKEGIALYLRGSTTDEPAGATLTHRAGTRLVEVCSIATLDRDGHPAASFLIGEPIVVRCHFSIRQASDASFFLLLSNERNETVFSAFQRDQQSSFRLAEGRSVEVTIDRLQLAPGSYRIAVGAFDQDGAFHDWAESSLVIEVQPFFVQGRAFDHRLGSVSLALEWSLV